MVHVLSLAFSARTLLIYVPRGAALGIQPQGEHSAESAFQSGRRNTIWFTCCHSLSALERYLFTFLGLRPRLFLSHGFAAVIADRSPSPKSDTPRGGYNESSQVRSAGK
jgi:hypothetical protein